MRFGNERLLSVRREPRESAAGTDGHTVGGDNDAASRLVKDGAVTVQADGNPGTRGQSAPRLGVGGVGVGSVNGATIAEAETAMAEAQSARQAAEAARQAAEAARQAADRERAEVAHTAQARAMEVASQAGIPAAELPKTTAGTTAEAPKPELKGMAAAESFWKSKIEASGLN